MMAELICFHCQKPNPILGHVGRKDECFSCKTDLHSCKNCGFYDPKSYNECKEPSADVVKEKDRANFCDYYKPREGGALKDNKDQLKAAAEALFKKG